MKHSKRALSLLLIVMLLTMFSFSAFAGEIGAQIFVDNDPSGMSYPSAADMLQAIPADDGDGEDAGNSEGDTPAATPTPGITANFRIIGGSVPGEVSNYNKLDFSKTYGDYHGGAYQNWMKTTSYTLENGTLSELVTKGMTAYGLGYDFSASANAVSVTATADFGSHELKRSIRYSYFRWCYTVLNSKGETVTDGIISENNILNMDSTLILSEGDTLLIHCVYDYRFELKTIDGVYWTEGSQDDYVQYYLNTKDYGSLADLAAADEVIALIAGMDARITPDSKDGIAKVRAAYDKLTEDQKKLVTNSDELFAAEAELKKIEDNAEKRTALPAPALSGTESVGLYSVTMTPATLEGVAAENYDLRYSISLDNKNWGVWQSGNVFEKLLPGKTYYVRAMAETKDWSTYGDSEASAAVTVKTTGSESEPVAVTDMNELRTALTNAATDGSLTVVDITKDIVIHDISGENYTVTIPSGANIVLTTSNDSVLWFDEPGRNSAIQITEGTTLTVRDMTVGQIAESRAGGWLTPGNCWQQTFRFMNATGVLNLDGAELYCDTGYGIIGRLASAWGGDTGTAGTVNMYSGAVHGLTSSPIMSLAGGSSVNLIPTGDIQLEGSISGADSVNLISAFGYPVSGATTADGSAFTALSDAQLKAASLDYSYGLRLNYAEAKTVAPVAAPVVVAADGENAAEADVTYTIEDNVITFTVKDREHTVIQFKQGSGYPSSFANDEEGLGKTFIYSGLTQDTEYKFTITYHPLVAADADASTELTLKTTYTPQALDAPVLDDAKASLGVTSVTVGTPAACSVGDAKATTMYRMSSDGGETWGEWQESNTFEGLESNKEYSFQAMYKVGEGEKTHLYLDSPVSNTLTVTTKMPYLDAPVMTGDAEEITISSITVPKVSPCTQDETAIAQYRMSSDGGETWGEWQASNAFTGLNSDTEYKFQARYYTTSTAWMSSDYYDAPAILTYKTLASLVKAADVSGKAGQEVEVAISLENNPGLIAVGLEVSYDRDKLELVSAKDGGKMNLSGSAGFTTSKNITDYPYVMNWEDSLSEVNYTGDDVIGTMTFKIKTDCAVDDTAAVSIKVTNAYDAALNTKTLKPQDGTITVVSHNWSDVTYTWADDFSTCTATRSCTCADCVEPLVETETVNAELVDSKAIDEEQGVDGYNKYKAVFTNAAFGTREYTEVLYFVKSAFEVSTVENCPGEEVQVTVDMKENPGIISARLMISYDAELLELVKAEDAGLLKGYMSSDRLDANPFVATWNDGLGENNTENGTLLTLTFRINGEAKVGDVANVEISYAEGDVHNSDMEDVLFRTMNGSVTVRNHAWNAPAYQWAADYSSCTAIARCNCGETLKETVVSTVKTVDATCESAGSNTYSAAFTNEVFAAQTAVVEIPKLGHHYTVSGNANGTELTYTCSCGDVKTETVVAGSPVLMVSDASGAKDEIVNVTVSVKNNPGFSWITFDLNYDTSILALVDAASCGAFDDVSRVGNTVSIGGINETENCYTDENLVTLSFKLLADCKEGTPVGISYVPENMLNYDSETVLFAIDNGVVSVFDYLLGDVNGDGLVNLKDVTLLTRYRAGWNVEIIKPAADVNKDSVIDLKDISILRRHLADWAGYETLPYGA